MSFWSYDTLLLKLVLYLFILVRFHVVWRCYWGFCNILWDHLNENNSFTNASVGGTVCESPNPSGRMSIEWCVVAWMWPLVAQEESCWALAFTPASLAAKWLSCSSETVSFIPLSLWNIWIAVVFKNRAELWIVLMYVYAYIKPVLPCVFFPSWFKQTKLLLADVFAKAPGVLTQLSVLHVG